jgi:hypothetical protein
LWDYYEKLYANKLENVEEMDKFLDTYDLTKLSHEDIKNLNRLTASNEIKSLIKMSPKTRMPTISTPIQHSTGIPSQSN